MCCAQILVCSIGVAWCCTIVLIALSNVLSMAQALKRSNPMMFWMQILPILSNFVAVSGGAIACATLPNCAGRAGLGECYRRLGTVH